MLEEQTWRIMIGVPDISATVLGHGGMEEVSISLWTKVVHGKIYGILGQI